MPRPRTACTAQLGRRRAARRRGRRAGLGWRAHGSCGGAVSLTGQAQGTERRRGGSPTKAGEEEGERAPVWGYGEPHCPSARRTAAIGGAAPGQLRRAERHPAFLTEANGRSRESERGVGHLPPASPVDYILRSPPSTVRQRRGRTEAGAARRRLGGA